MFTPNPSATIASGSQPQPMDVQQDVQQIVGLLGNLMPLLLRLQSQPQPFQGGPGNAMGPNPALDHQAAENLIADMSAHALRTLSSYRGQCRPARRPSKQCSDRHPGGAAVCRARLCRGLQPDLARLSGHRNDPGDRSAASPAAGRPCSGRPDFVVDPLSAIEPEARHGHNFGQG